MAGFLKTCRLERYIILFVGEAIFIRASVTASHIHETVQAFSNFSETISAGPSDDLVPSYLFDIAIVNPFSTSYSEVSMTPFTFYNTPQLL